MEEGLRKYRNRRKKDQWLFQQRYIIDDIELRQLIGVISEDNFFRNGTLKENVSWNVPHFDEFQADLFARELQIDEDLENYKEDRLNSKISSVEGTVNS